MKNIEVFHNIVLKICKIFWQKTETQNVKYVRISKKCRLFSKKLAIILEIYNSLTFKIFNEF